MRHQRKCLECKEVFSGRSDKKFCSDQCRNTYNNHLYACNSAFIRNTNRVLKKNRRILEALKKQDKTLVSKISLYENGFNFRFFTSLIETKGGKRYYQCYDYAFIPEGLYHYYIVKLKEKSCVIDEVDVEARPFEQP